jgi:hypothetical protein
MCYVLTVFVMEDTQLLNPAKTVTCIAVLIMEAWVILLMQVTVICFPCFVFSPFVFFFFAEKHGCW